MKAEFLQRQDSFLFKLGLNTFEVFDLYSKNTLYPSILMREVVETPQSVEPPLLVVSVESKPSHGKSDIDVKVILEEMNFVVIPPLIQRICK